MTLRNNLVSEMIMVWEGVKYDHCVSHKYPQSVMKSSSCPFALAWSTVTQFSRINTTSHEISIAALKGLLPVNHKTSALRQAAGDLQGIRPGLASASTGGSLSVCRPRSSQDQRLAFIFFYTHQGRAEGCG